MSLVQDSKTLTHAATLAMLTAAVTRAEEIGQPQRVVIVDTRAAIGAEAQPNRS